MGLERQDQLAPFPATEWSLVDRARSHADGSTRRLALGTIVHRYLPALRAFLRLGCRLRAEQAEELLQGFVADKIVGQQLVSAARRERGRLRNLLLVSLKRYVLTELRRARRGGAIGGAAVEPAGRGDNPVHLFNLIWAREMVAETVRRMREECAASGRLDVWGIFDGRVVRPALEGTAPAPYDELVVQLGLTSPLQACNLLATGKRTFARVLRAVAAEHTAPGSPAQEEIDDLRRIISAGSDRASARRRVHRARSS